MDCENASRVIDTTLGNAAFTQTFGSRGGVVDDDDEDGDGGLEDFGVVCLIERESSVGVVIVSSSCVMLMGLEGSINCWASERWTRCTL